MKPILALAGAALAVACATAPAHAEQRVTAHVPVAYGDLDPSTPAGAATMMTRINRAARIACGGRPEPGPLMLAQMQAYRACRAQAIGETVAALDAPLVTARHAAMRAGRFQVAAR